jgi:hypothetical protein
MPCADDDQRLARLVQAVEQAQHLNRGCAVEVAGRFVGQDHERLVAQRPSDRHSLTLTTRECHRQEARPVGEANPVQQLGGPPPCRSGRAPCQQCRELHVLHGGGLLQQMKRLEHEPDSATPHLGQRPLTQLVDAATGQPHLSTRGPIQTA